MGVWVGKGRRKKKRVLICANSAKPHSGIVGENSVCSGNTVFFASSFFGTLYGDICTKVAECRLGTFVRSKTNSQSLAQGEVSNFIPDASPKKIILYFTCGFSLLTSVAAETASTSMTSSSALASWASSSSSGEEDDPRASIEKKTL